MIEFVVDTPIIQEYSKDTLAAVARILNENATIGHVVIEGHASQEGTYTHNYDLAAARARRIWEFLLERGVAEARISYRGFGKVKPVTLDGVPLIGEDEASRQRNRRVQFLIVQRFGPDDPLPTYPEAQLLPWNGEIVPVISPPPPVFPEAPAGAREGAPAGDRSGFEMDDEIELLVAPPDEEIDPRRDPAPR